MSVVLGLDLGGKLGWCVLDGAELRAASVQRLGVKSGPRGGLVEVPGLRAHDLRSFLRALLEQHVPNVLAFERVRRHAGTDAAHVYGALRHAVLEVAATMDRPPRLVEVEVAEGKRALAGKGNADKAAMVAAAEKLHPGRPWPEDAADALGVALAGGRP
jgi:Holliday junction resolvasome RuvABC endonuclease subunit